MQPSYASESDDRPVPPADVPPLSEAAEVSAPRRPFSIDRVIVMVGLHFLVNVALLALVIVTAFQSLGTPGYLEVALTILNPLVWLVDPLLPDSTLGTALCLVCFVSGGVLYGLAFSWLASGPKTTAEK
jgi:apolipoprotein N-acyltransferase